MSARRSDHIPFKGNFTHVSAWGNPGNPAIVMWHGLARTGRDFDALAQSLSTHYFVICPDTVGRGLSCWADDPAKEYSLQNYAEQAVSLLDIYRIDKLKWIGTSMGALIGMRLAGGVLKDRITHLVLNDIGPEIPDDALARIVEYVGNPPQFANMTAFEIWLRKVYAPFGPNSDTFWRVMADTSARRLESGALAVHYDPRIIWQFTHNGAEMPLWKEFDTITAKTLLTRGADSDVLPESLAQRMCERGPRPVLHTFENCGHAPTFTDEKAQATLRAFLST